MVIIVPSVVRSAPQPSRPAMTPLTVPIAAPAASVSTNTAGTGSSRMWKQKSATKADMAKFEPTERSMPPTATTISSASTTRPPSAAYCARLRRFDTVK